MIGMIGMPLAAKSIDLNQPQLIEETDRKTQ